ncbi:CAAX protease [Methanosarcina sp. 2.H.T.1A.6]|uniref:CPBP family intramembrane glutamic endopeptidase n=1 Tax=unclassified Methanosarcina TaxID=2644672 RepID=UPI0006218C99|nr:MULTISPECIES: CPBP family intramembrane glutamic endopeptidase [unclassified Methanosarcina]KKG14546.1 CAAX protease [Methanosarcina sp. 2.H.T.1A.3]KKG24202.1 CAAX protease [Methanosarcina sp. 2.H.T.1A.8]KKG24985.1 CAAX protease [Methanosarcina sp. 2.H.T.1A.6]KKG27608.1 CAAX protease [Methanosarcina sp. 2.H.T.1A.15]
MASPDYPSSELEAGQISLPELGKMFKMQTDEKTGFLKKMFSAGAPVIVIAFAELLIFSGRIKEAAVTYTLLLIILSLSIMISKKMEIRKVHQALILLPILRMVNISMPIFFEANLYSFVFIYVPMTIPATIISIHQKIPGERKVDLLRKMWIYLPVSVLAGLIFAEAEYLLIQTSPLIPDLSPINLLELAIIMIFVVGLIEEFIFRGIIQTRLEEFLGPAGGILLASLLFGIMHSSYGTPYEMAYTFLAGGALGYLFYRTKSFSLVVMIHGFINIFLFGLIPHLGPGLGLI